MPAPPTSRPLVTLPPPDESAPRAPFETHIERLIPHAEVVKPPGEGPFPVVIQLHGCGGKGPFQKTWAHVARDAGWAAVIVDSYAHRNISPIEARAAVCTGLKLWGRERAGDLYAAMAWLRRQPWADSSRIVAAGWSHGGWTVLDALALAPGVEAEASTKLAGLPEEPLAGLVGAFVLYPYVGMASLARQRGLRYDASPVALVAGRDMTVGGRSVQRALAAMPTPGAPVRIEWLAAATHAFDEPEAIDLRTRYDAALSAQAQAMLVDYLAARAP